MLPGLRQTLRNHAALAMMLVLATLIARVLVPTGYMPTMEHGRIVIELCSGHGPVEPPVAISLDHNSGGHKGEGSTGHDTGHDKDSVCPFASLLLSWTPGADAILLALALLFIVRSGLHLPDRVPPARARFLIPPITGPPARA